MDNYIAALHTYEEVQGKRATSYVSTLANLGEGRVHACIGRCKCMSLCDLCLPKCFIFIK